MEETLKYRQVHLDFHTSGLIPDIGAEFDPEEFAETVEKAHVDSITCFARCHHGWLYYDSKAMPERIHPNLKRKNLLKEQIDACHKRNIKVPVYTTVQWDEKIAHEHYDWLCVEESGAPFRVSQLQPGFYRNICLNSPYVEFFKEHLRDIFDCLGEVDGLFLDILNIGPCCCNHCMDSMRKLGLNVEDEKVRYEFAQTVFDRFQAEITAFIHEIQPGCPVFYNVGFIGTQHRKNKDTFTHFEIESLPGGAWGYGHFPPTAMYARTLGLPMTGQTGRFHLDWGDFSSLRYLASLQYECFRALAYGCGCSIGDQLHPNGKMNKHTYELIGKVYKEVEEKEPWCKGAIPVTEAAVLAPMEFKGASSSFVVDELSGAVKFLNDICIQADVIDSQAEFEKYKLLILPDSIEQLSQEAAAKIQAYVEQGGALISSYHSGIMQDGSTAAFLPADIKGDAEYSPDFIAMTGKVAAGIPDMEFVMYERGASLEPREGSDVLLETMVPYFNRTWEHYCSHRHTPCSYQYGPSALVQKGRVYQFAHPVFKIQEEYATEWVKQLLKNVVYEILGSPLVTHNGPSTLDLKLTHQPDQERYVLHALHYIPVRKAKKMEMVEDVIPLYGTEIAVRVDAPVESVTIVPGQKEIEYFSDEEAGKITFTVPEICGHEMIEIKGGKL
ncbi:alpha-amylase family protein [Faecalicatena orotica]|uniref:alpha-amylase family protein n=1 Tax=Faecalicatena orotica TaxID=1544 RepID=UPI003217A967